MKYVWLFLKYSSFYIRGGRESETRCSAMWPETWQKKKLIWSRTCRRVGPNSCQFVVDVFEPCVATGEVSKGNARQLWHVIINKEAFRAEDWSTHRLEVLNVKFELRLTVKTEIFSAIFYPNWMFLNVIKLQKFKEHTGRKLNKSRRSPLDPPRAVCHVAKRNDENAVFSAACVGVKHPVMNQSQETREEKASSKNSLQHDGWADTQRWGVWLHVTQLDNLIPDLSHVTSGQSAGWLNMWLLVAVGSVLNQYQPNNWSVCVSGSTRDQTGQSLSPAVCRWRATGQWILPWTLKMDAARPVEGENSKIRIWSFISQQNFWSSQQASCPRGYLLCC